MESLRKDIAPLEKDFKDIRIGTPLLYTPHDFEDVIIAITKNGAKEGATVLVGHGTYTPATAQYAMMDYMLHSKGYNDYYVTTVEGYPSFDDMVAKLEAGKTKKVLLMPFMFVAGDHANNDIAVDMKEELEGKGYQVSVFMQGLGQNPEIQNIFIDHAKFAAKHKMINIMDKKKVRCSKRLKDYTLHPFERSIYFFRKDLTRPITFIIQYSYEENINITTVISPVYTRNTGTRKERVHKFFRYYIQHPGSSCTNSQKKYPAGYKAKCSYEIFTDIRKPSIR